MCVSQNRFTADSHAICSSGPKLLLRTFTTGNPFPAIPALTMITSGTVAAWILSGLHCEQGARISAVTMLSTDQNIPSSQRHILRLIDDINPALPIMKKNNEEYTIIPIV